MSNRYEPSRDMLPGYAASSDPHELFPGVDKAALTEFLIDRGRCNHHHRSERARNNARAQGQARKAKRQRKARAAH